MAVGFFAVSSTFCSMGKDLGSRKKQKFKFEIKLPSCSIPDVDSYFPKVSVVYKLKIV